MKKNNLYLSIFNVIFYLAFLLRKNYIIYMYQDFYHLIKILCIAIIMLNIISSIFCFIKKQKKIAVVQIIIAILEFSLIKSLNYFRLRLLICIIIASIIVVILNHEIEGNNKNKFLNISYGVLGGLLAISIVLPIIYTGINIQRIKKALPQLSNLESEWMYIDFDGSTYIFKNKKGKIINYVDENKYGEISGIAIRTTSKHKVAFFVNAWYMDGKMLLLGFTDKGYVTDYKGDVLFKLCCDYGFFNLGNMWISQIGIVQYIFAYLENQGCGYDFEFYDGIYYEGL